MAMKSHVLTKNIFTMIKKFILFIHETMPNVEIYWDSLSIKFVSENFNSLLSIKKIMFKNNGTLYKYGNTSKYCFEVFGIY